MDKDGTSVGTVVKLLDRSGLGYVTPEGSNELFVFTFDKIQDYKGEEAQQLGLRTGATVTIDFKNHRISSIRLNRGKKEG